MNFDTLKKRLEKNGFTVSCFNTSAEAADYLEGAVKNEVVGIGGSVTARDMGLAERLGKNNTVHSIFQSNDSRYRYPEFTAYLTSVNAIAETGELVNIDNSGNRVAATLFGPKKVYFVVGRNKIRPDLASAIERARQVAAPPNAKRLDIPAPCVKTGRCHDCDSPKRLCRALVVHMRPMALAEHSEVVLIDEDLGY